MTNAYDSDNSVSKSSDEDMAEVVSDQKPTLPVRASQNDLVLLFAQKQKLTILILFVVALNNNIGYHVLLLGSRRLVSAGTPKKTRYP